MCPSQSHVLNTPRAAETLPNNAELGLWSGGCRLAGHLATGSNAEMEFVLGCFGETPPIARDRRDEHTWMVNGEGV